MIEREFPKFKKVPRWSRDIIITEKIDGTNALVDIEEVSGVSQYDAVKQVENDPYTIAANFEDLPEGTVQFMRAGSRERWLAPKAKNARILGGKSSEVDNYGFAQWVNDNAFELFKLGVGTHYGEWWGQGIGRKYGGRPRSFSLFNVGRWTDPTVRPACCEVVPTLYAGANHEGGISNALDTLLNFGSIAASGFMQPEGIVIFHTASGQLYKKLLEKDELPKGLAASAI